MRTSYSEDQQAVAEAFGDLFAREATPEAVRAAEDGCGFDPGLWSKLAAAGAPGMAVGVEHGGGGASLVDLAVVVFGWGRRIAPVPLVEHAVTARLLAALADDGAVDAALVEAVASGELLATIALRPLGADGTGGQLPTGAVADSVAGLSLRQPEADSTARLVPAGAVADVVVGIRGEALVLGRSEPPGVARPNTADLPLADRDLSNAEVLATGELARRAWDWALTEWKALMAVAYAGLASEVLSMGVAYVKQRLQFGVPVGSFQAVQHGLADAATRSEGARLLAFRAVGAVDSGGADGARLASMALLFGAESARFAADRVLQYHGGYGYSAEYDVQLYYRRAAAWLLQLGDPGHEVARLADADFGPKSQAA